MSADCENPAEGHSQSSCYLPAPARPGGVTLNSDLTILYSKVLFLQPHLFSFPVFHVKFSREIFEAKQISSSASRFLESIF